MSDETPVSPARSRALPQISEDWAATAVGLLLLVLILTGIISRGVLQ
ncbi:hypothetical protein [Micromonospora rosaria]|nr:hypothetical protein [Micromonospora rosaria]